MATDFTIREAVEADVVTINSFIHELAAFEKLSHACKADTALLAQYLFQEPKRAHAIIAEVAGEAVGFALYFYNFSTFLARPGIYIEDAYVREAHRGSGIGKQMFAHLAAKAVAEGCGRLEWWVLDWNTRAIDFYRSIGAKAMDEWTVQRVEGEALNQLAQSLAA